MFRRTDPTDWMWAQACDLIAQAERMHGQFFRLASSVRGERAVGAAGRRVRRRARGRHRRRHAGRGGGPRADHDGAGRAGGARGTSAALRRPPVRGAAARDSLRLLRAAHCASRRAAGSRHARADRRLPDHPAAQDDEHDDQTTDPAPLSAEGAAPVVAPATESKPRAGGNVAAAAGGCADHPAGAQRRAVPRHRGSAAGRARKLARRGPGSHAPAAPAGRAAAEQARSRCAGTRRLALDRHDRQPAALHHRAGRFASRHLQGRRASACCSSWKAIRSPSRACNSSRSRSRRTPRSTGAPAASGNARTRS